MATAFPKKKLVMIATSAILCVGTLLPQFHIAGKAYAADSDNFTLRVLHTNDTHAHLDNTNDKGEGSNAAKRVEAIKENRNDNTILLDAGDVFSGSLYFTKFNGLADLDFMNMAGYNAMVPGNHEFDKGPAGLAPFISKANFPIVSANIDYSKDKDLAPLFKDEIGGDKEDSYGHIYPAVILNVDGQKVGVFGLTTEDTVALSSPGDTVKFQDHEQKAKETVKRLQDAGVNKIIALTHLGYDVDQELAKDVPGIDIIVGGHSHTKLDKPTEVDHANDGPTIIVQTGEYGDFLGKLDAVFDSAGRLKSYDGKLLDVSTYKEDPEAKKKLDGYASQLKELNSKVVGKSSVDLTYQDADGNRLVRKEETNLGDLITDGIADLTKEKVKDLLPADELKDIKGYIGLQNGGGIRTGIKKGDITFGDVLTVMPFANSIVGLKVTGKELVDALENGVSDYPAEKGGFPHVSGMKFVFDPSKPKQTIDTETGKILTSGERIQDVQIENEDGSYSKLDPDAYYVVGTNSFTADGGDFYYALKQAKNDGRYYEFYVPDYEVFTNYLDKVGTVNIQNQGRITLTTSYVASSITKIADPEKNAKALTLPTLPAGFTVSIKSSDKPDVIATDGKIYPPNAATKVKLVLSVKKTSDGSTVDTGAIEVTVPAKSSTPSEPSEDSPSAPSQPAQPSTPSAPTQPSNPVSTPAAGSTPSADIVTVTSDQLKVDSTTGKGTIVVPNTAKGIKLPVALMDQVKGSTLEIKSDKIVLDIPMDLIKKLVNKLSATDQKDSTISLGLSPLSPSDVQNLLVKGSLSSKANVKAGGEVYDLSLAITTSGGKTERMTQFEQPITISMKVDPTVNSKLSGIYYISDDGSLEYVGGKYSNGQITTDINDLSKYAVLEVSKEFADLASTHWAYDVVNELVSKLIVTGTSDTTFEPGRSVTRAEFTSMVVKALKLKTEGTNKFTDVAADKWYAQPISIATNAGIVNGKSATTFDPNGKITREEMVVMMMNAYKLSHDMNEAGSNDNGTFTDQADISTWAADAVKAAVALDLVHGRDTHTFAPKGSTTRAEAAQVLSNLINH